MGHTKVTTLQDAAAANGNGTAVELLGASIIHVQISGTFSATVTFQVSLDNTNWATIGLIAKVDGSTVATAPTAAGAWFGDVRGAIFFRTVISSYLSGAVTVKAGVYTAE
jgi:hypothetical protein